MSPLPSGMQRSCRFRASVWVMSSEGSVSFEVLGSGHLASFEDLADLYRAEHLALVRLARLITGSQELAEESVHDAFITVFQHRAAVRVPVAYLRRAVINNCQSVLRRAAVERRKLEIVGSRDGPASALVLAPEADDLWRALDVLTVDQRTALILRYHEDLTVAQIAEAMGKRPGTIKSMLSRGLGRLRLEVEL